jgi:hypothetical protein
MTISLRQAVVAVTAVALLGLAAIGPGHAASSTAAPIAAPLVAGSPTVSGELSLAGDIDAILAADQVSPGPAAARDKILAGPLRRLAAAHRFVHATVVLDLPKTGLTTIQVDHGTISAAGATSLTIAEAGGGSATVTLASETRVRRNGDKAAIADLKVGDEVFTLSKVESGGTVAYLVVVPKP